MKHIAIIGGGITGVTSAYTLAKAGYKVTLIEKTAMRAWKRPMPTAASSRPRTPRSGPTQHPREGAEVDVHQGRAPAHEPCPQLAQAELDDRVCGLHPQIPQNTEATTRLAIAAREHLFAWAQAEGIDFDHQRKGILHIYRNKAGFEHAGKVSTMLAAGGLSRRTVTPEEMRAIEPTLQGTYYGGYYTESDSTGDIHKFTHGMSQACARLGVTTLYGHQVASASTDGTVATLKLQHEGGTETPPV